MAAAFFFGCHFGGGSVEHHMKGGGLEAALAFLAEDVVSEDGFGLGLHFDELAAVAVVGLAVSLVYGFEAQNSCSQQEGLGCAVELELDDGAFGQAVLAYEVDAAGADVAGYGFDPLGDAYGSAWYVGAEEIQVCF